MGRPRNWARSSSGAVRISASGVFTVPVRVLVACSPGGEQDPKCLAGVTGARTGRIRAGQGLAGGAHRVQLIGLAAVAAGALRAVGLDDQVPAIRGASSGRPGARLMGEGVSDRTAGKYRNMSGRRRTWVHSPGR